MITEDSYDYRIDYRTVGHCDAEGPRAALHGPTGDTRATICTQGDSDGVMKE